MNDGVWEVDGHIHLSLAPHQWRFNPAISSHSAVFQSLFQYRSECSAETAQRCTGGRAIFASGSPFNDVEHEGQVIASSQVWTAQTLSLLSVCFFWVKESLTSLQSKSLTPPIMKRYLSFVPWMKQLCMRATKTNLDYCPPCTSGTVCIASLGSKVQLQKKQSIWVSDHTWPPHSATTDTSSLVWPSEQLSDKRGSSQTPWSTDLQRWAKPRINS